MKHTDRFMITHLSLIPMVLIVFSFGIAVHRIVPIGPKTALLCAILYFGLWCWLGWRYVFYIVIFLCGLWRMGLEADIPMPALASERVLLRIRGIVISPPWPTHWLNVVPGDEMGCFYKNDWLLESEAIQQPDFTWCEQKMQLQIKVLGTMPRLEYGDQVEVLGWVARIQGPENPGQADLQMYWQGQGIFHRMTIKYPSNVLFLQSNAGNPIMAWVHHLRYRYVEILREVVGRYSGAMVGALLLGTRELVADSVLEDFKLTGVYHLLAISGLHVSILAWLLYRIILRLRIPYAIGYILLLIFLAFYALLTNLQVPVLRSTLMIGFYITSLLTGSRPRSIHTLSLAALVILWIQPLDLWQPGFQLTCLASLAIIRVYQPLAQPMQTKIYGQKIKGWEYIRAYCWHYVRELTVLSWCTWWITIPLLVLHFGYISVLAPLWSILTIPLVTLILALACLLMFTILGIGWIGMALGYCLHCLIWLLQTMVHGFALVPGVVLFLLPPILVFVALFYLWVMVGYFKNQRAYLYTMVAFILVLGSGHCRILTERSEEMTVLSVGNGCGIYLKFKTGQRILYDCGSKNPGAGSQIFVPFFKHRGITHLDGIILSHSDADHCNAIADILRCVSVSGIYVNTGFRDHGQPLLLEMQQAGIPIIEVAHQQTFPGLQNLAFLDPGHSIKPSKSNWDNERSLLALIRMGHHRILLTADLGYKSGKVLLQQKIGPVHILQIPHHAGKMSLSKALHQHFLPKIAFVNADARFEQSEVIQKYQVPGTQVYLTSQAGALQFYFIGPQIFVKRFLLD